MTRRGTSYAAACALVVLLSSARAHAHPVAFGVLVLREDGAGAVDAQLRFSGTETRLGGVSPRFDPRCRPLRPATERNVPNAILIEVRLRCEGGLRGATVGVVGREGEQLELAVRATLADGTTFDDRLDDERRETTIAPERDDLVRYFWLGVEHIGGGIDHLLFVLGLLVLVRGARRVVATVTAFTVGHSVTLGLAALGWIAVRPAPVEACIALSILVLALELARPPDALETLGAKRPWLLAGGFGLLHGLGFASALRAAGLPADGLLGALFGFNVGVEVGQLAFVAICFAMYGLGRVALERARIDAARAREWMVTGLGGTAAYFVLERLTALGG